MKNGGDMCKFCEGECTLYDDTENYLKINENNQIGKYIEVQVPDGIMCVKIYFCPVCGVDLITER